MRHLLILSLVTILTAPLIAQDTKKEINSQVWKPFIQAYNNFNTEQFMSVYSKSIVRVPQDQKMIFDFAEYKKNINRENQFNKNYKIKAALELRFLNRVHSKDIAYETGILKIKMTDNNGKPAIIYSKFQVLLKKENGIWKIHFDTDSSEGGKISEADFNKAEKLE
jgi:ketosteroid isomerase-like protein